MIPRRRKKMMLATLTTALALTALASASASAHEYIIEGMSLSGTEEVTGTIGTTKIEMALPIGITTVCKSNSYTGTIETAGASKGKITLSGCSDGTICVPSIPAFNVTDELTTFEGAIGDKFLPTGTMETLFVIHLKGEECSIKTAKFPIVGHITCKLLEGEVEKVTHAIECTQAGNQLTVAGEAAYHVTMETSMEVKLVSGKKWRTR
jgi:hypothetical protein